jgi:hypothetical protein
VAGVVVGAADDGAAVDHTATRAEAAATQTTTKRRTLQYRSRAGIG